MSDAPENVPAGSNPVSGPALKNLPWYMNVCEAKMSWPGPALKGRELSDP